MRVVSRAQLKGFTLVELLIVLVIMSLLLSLVPPLLSNVMPSVTIKATANDLLHDIKYVRNMAVLNGRQTSLILNAVDGSYFSEAKDNGVRIDLPTDIALSISDVGGEIANAESIPVRFFADGSSSGASILLRAEDRAYTIQVDWLTGRVSLAEGGPDDRS